MRRDPKMQLIVSRDESERSNEMTSFDLLRHHDARRNRDAQAIGGGLD
jgi:hypothetical protein